MMDLYGPRRPAWTSGRHEPRGAPPQIGTTVRVFGEWARQSNVTRQIAVLDDPAKNPVCKIRHTRAGKECGRILIFHESAPTVRLAIAATVNTRERYEPDPIPCGEFIVRVWSADGQLHFGRSDKSGNYASRVTVLNRVHIEALSLALDHLESVVTSRKRSL